MTNSDPRHTTRGEGKSFRWTSLPALPPLNVPGCPYPFGKLCWSIHSRAAVGLVSDSSPSSPLGTPASLAFPTLAEHVLEYLPRFCFPDWTLADRITDTVHHGLCGRNVRVSLPSRDFQLIGDMEHFITASCGLMAASGSSDKGTGQSPPCSPSSWRGPVSFRHEELIGNKPVSILRPVATLSPRWIQASFSSVPSRLWAPYQHKNGKEVTYWVKMLSSWTWMLTLKILHPTDRISPGLPHLGNLTSGIPASVNPNPQICWS